jgi:hypothetical protein
MSIVLQLAAYYGLSPLQVFHKGEKVLSTTSSWPEAQVHSTFLTKIDLISQALVLTPVILAT